MFVSKSPDFIKSVLVIDVFCSHKKNRKYFLLIMWSKIIFKISFLQHEK